ncbi:hybrid sensor histidine kinase/response regulator [Novosphingobium cyanobacteriorum]|uniref:histidine kinase n=1 Tax=Novosphingobium cyanobacteriorum TaxID=3024215 RepID=A0ABT6CPB1_9SPHN|nr:hybrid sensor histidine kinase/response regulator [Novosphingobium cyanobacteriorum]MDF8335759.1 hybrid sensor histidine kinase/response regulator [Novosphingobium cyanobacteriorum]
MTAEPIHCLLVDDLPENLLALEALLQRKGLVCHKATSGEEALELLLVQDMALALLDVQMPGMDGFQLAEFMRGAERTRHIPIIFLTAGSADHQRRFRGYEAGAVDFLQKPIEADILRSKAAVFFDLYAQRRRIIRQRDELDTLTAALKSADQHKNRFLAILGHELRNPVAALNAGLNLLDRRSEGPAGAVVRGQMQRSLNHLTRLVEDLLNIARINEGKISLSKKPFVLQDALGYAMESCQGVLEADGHTLVAEIAPEPIWLFGDEVRIAQAVINLITNAAKYTPDPGTIHLSASRTNDTAWIEITDTGIGIPPEAQDGIFELFAQIDGTSRAARDGLGIGLALVRQLVGLHSGDVILVQSAPGAGSTFRIELPLAPPDA